MERYIEDISTVKHTKLNTPSAFQYHVSNTYHALCWTHCDTLHSTRPRTKRVLQTKVYFWFTSS